MAENNKFFFRTEPINKTPESQVDVPVDLEWAVKPGQVIPINRAVSGGAGAGAPGSGPGIDGADTYSGTTVAEDQSYSGAPDFTIGTPRVKGIIRQEVSQNAEGATTIDVTFSVDNGKNENYEWEIRVTR